MIKLSLILPCLYLMFQPLNAKVEAPNYNFSLDTLSDFMPGMSLDELEKKFGKPEEMNDLKGVLTKKFYVAQIRYKFPVLVQTREGKVLDMYARLPSYFLHDLFFQSMVNRHGKQSSYTKVGEEAVYTWEKGEVTHIYSASCTITCFPVFYTSHSNDKSFSPIIEQMKKANQKPKK